jgi:hypothetical protein
LEAKEYKREGNSRDKRKKRKRRESTKRRKELKRQDERKWELTMERGGETGKMDESK